ncbi:MAG: hypothetical protein AAGD07_03820 [Planctomycetota bacterium]
MKVARRAGIVRFEGCEFDAPYNTLGPHEEVAVVQRGMLDDTVLRMAAILYTPVAQILSVESQGFRILFRHAIPSSDAGDRNQRLMQVWRDRSVGGIWSRERHKGLVLRPVWPRSSRSSAGSEQPEWARPVLGQGDDAYFANLGAANARFTARLVRSRPGTLHVQAWRSESTKDRMSLQTRLPGCDVLITAGALAQSAKPRELVALTDAEGMATIESKDGMPLQITLRYEDKELTKLAIPGVDNERLMFLFADQRGKSPYKQRLIAIHDAIRDRGKRVTQLVRQINAIARSGDVDAVRALSDEITDPKILQRWQEQIDALADSAARENLDVAGELNICRGAHLQLREMIQQQDAALANANRFAAAEKQLTELQELWEGAQWELFLERLREFARQFPDHTEAKLLPRIEKQMTIQDKQHALSRDFLNGILGQPASDVYELWSSVETSVNCLIDRGDVLYLYRVNEQLASWSLYLKEQKNVIESLASARSSRSHEEQRLKYNAMSKGLQAFQASVPPLAKQVDKLFKRSSAVSQQ